MTNKILVIFGSKSDSGIYEEITSALQEKKIDFQLEICSAHRNPERLSEILKDDYKVIIAGAGLAAHLPGVIASKTISPVIGVPCDGTLNGLDAFLSIIQMPPGIPVLAVGVNNSQKAARFAGLLLKNYEGVNIINHEKKNKAEDILKKLNVEYEVSDNFRENKININFVDIKKGKVKDKDFLTINVPVIDESKAKDALKLLKKAKKGLWVGINMAENAAIAAVEILNLEGKYYDILNGYREELKANK